MEEEDDDVEEEDDAEAAEAVDKEGAAVEVTAEDPDPDSMNI